MMQDISLNFGVSGEERKRLVKAVSAYKQIPSEYLGVPSFAFRVDEIVLETRFAEHRHQPCPTHSQHAGDVGVGGNDDFGMVVPAEQPFVGHENHGQSVQSVARRHAVLRSAELGKRFAETRVLLS